MDAMEVAAALRRAAENAGCGTHSVMSGGGDCPDGSCSECLERSRAWFRDAADAIERSALPEGVEWPRINDKPVLFGDKVSCLEYGGKVSEVSEFCFQKGRVTILDVFRDDYNGTTELTPANRCERPILAGDGEPLEVGQTVWHVGNGIEFTVVSLPKPEEYQAVKLRLDDGAFTGLDPDQLTHQRPVLDADGKPVEVGKTYYGGDGVAWFVGGINHKNKSHPIVARNGSKGTRELRPEWLTLTPPDTWERLYLDMGNGRMTVGEFERRCKALAEKEAR